MKALWNNYGWVPIFILLIAAMLPFIRSAHASPLDCEGIRDADQRHLCRAITRPQKSECEFIKSQDVRQECRARVK